MPKLSIVIPTLNEEKGIETVLRQLHSHLAKLDAEIIVTDDGSTDRTAEIAGRYATVVFHKGGKRTIAANRNNGAKSARGEYLAFIDADIFVPEPASFFKTLLDDFAAEQDLAGITVNVKVLPEKATVADRVIMSIANFFQRVLNNALHMGNASGEFQMVRQSAFGAISGYDENLAVAEDADLFFRLQKVGPTRFEGRLTVYHDGRRMHALGWPRLLWGWIVNYFYVRLLHRSYDGTWGQIR